MEKLIELIKSKTLENIIEEITNSGHGKRKKSSVDLRKSNMMDESEESESGSRTNLSPERNPKK